MPQQNYISDIDASFGKGFYNFAGFLFYVNGWSWSNLSTNTNYSKVNMAEFKITNRGLDFANAPVDVITHIKQNNEGTTPVSLFTAATTERLYMLAATSRRFAITSTWRAGYRDIYEVPLLNTSENRAPTVDGLQRWDLWSGDIQAYTDDESGIIRLGSTVFCKNVALQGETPVSIINSDKSKFYGPGGFGEIIEDRYITNYQTSSVAYREELFALRDGWYGIVTLDSSPRSIFPSIGLDFDTFFNLRNSTVIGFHPSYPINYNIVLSLYGQNSLS